MGGKKAISPRLEGYLERDVRGQRGSFSTAPLPHSSLLATTHTWLSVPVLVCPIPRLCRPIREPCAEHGPTSQGCAGGDPGAAAVLYAHQGHPASPPTPSQPQSDPSPRAALRSLLIQCLQSAHLPTHCFCWKPEASGALEPIGRPAWRISAGWSSPPLPHPQKGLALSPPPCLHANNKADNNNYSTSVSWVLGGRLGDPGPWHPTKRREQRLLQLGFIPILIHNHPIISQTFLKHFQKW